MMYKFVNTLTDSKPWTEYFKKQTTRTSQWHANPTHSVIILKEDIKGEGVDDAKKVQVVSEVAQTTKQASAILTKRLQEENIALQAQKKNGQGKAGAAKAAKRLTNKTKTIFTKYKDNKKQA